MFFSEKKHSKQEKQQFYSQEKRCKFFFFKELE